MKTPRIMLTILLLISFIVSGLAYAGKIKDEPGFVDLDWIEIPDDASEIQDIDLTSILKTVADDAKDTGDDELAQILEMIRSIRVKGFGVDDKHSERVESAVNKMTKQLKKDGWKRLIYLKDEGEIMSISTMYHKDDLVGLMVMAFEPGEEVLFANIMGDLDLPAILKLVGAMDGEGLEDLLEGFDDLDGVHVDVDVD